MTMLTRRRFAQLSGLAAAGWAAAGGVARASELLEPADAVRFHD